MLFRSLQEFVAEVFRCLDLDWKDHVVVDAEFLRPTDLLVSRADPSKAERQLGWKARYKVADVVKGMLG